MTWTKVGEEFLGDPVLLGLPRGVRLLSVEALVWSNQQGTDGRIPRHMLPHLTDEPDAEVGASQLVVVGKWAATEAGWEIVRFLEDQWSAADVAALVPRLWSRCHRWHRQGRHDLCLPGRCPNAPSHASSNASRDATPYRSGPTVPTDPPDREEGRAVGGAACAGGAVSSLGIGAVACPVLVIGGGASGGYITEKLLDQFDRWTDEALQAKWNYEH